MGFKWNLSILSILLLLIIGFQNCSPSNSPVNFSDDSLKLGNESDSGTPYEGKIYATTGSLCADGTEIHSRIVMSSFTQAKLNRESCQDIPAVELSSNDFQLDTNTDTLVYKNQNFKYIGKGPMEITNLAITNDANDFYYSYSFAGQPSWLQIYLDTDNNPATGYSHFGIGADFLIENDNVWVYSAAAGDPQSTWAWTSLISANKNLVSQNVSWSFAKSAIGSPTSIKLIAETSLGAKTSIITQIPK